MTRWPGLLGMAALIAVACVATVGWVDDYGQRQFKAGRGVERSAWQAAEAKSLRQANTRIATLHEQARERERRHARAMADISARYEEELKHEQTRFNSVVADLRGHVLRLYVPVTGATGSHATSDGGGCAGGPASKGPTGCDGPARAELSVEAAEFLVGLATEADEVVHQLAACQAVINADHQLQQGKP